MTINDDVDPRGCDQPDPGSDDLSLLRWAHERLTDLDFAPSGDEGQHHPTAWWEARWGAHALEAQALLVAETWHANAEDLGVIGWKQARS